MLLLNTTKSDYLYPLQHTVGFNVHVFNSHEFPDVETGSFLQLLLMPETEAFFKLGVTTVDATPAVSDICEARDAGWLPIYKKQNNLV